MVSSLLSCQPVRAHQAAGCDEDVAEGDEADINYDLLAPREGHEQEEDGHGIDPDLVADNTDPQPHVQGQDEVGGNNHPQNAKNPPTDDAKTGFVPVAENKEQMGPFQKSGLVEILASLEIWAFEDDPADKGFDPARLMKRDSPLLLLNTKKQVLTLVMVTCNPFNPEDVADGVDTEDAEDAEDEDCANPAADPDKEDEDKSYVDAYEADDANDAEDADSDQDEDQTADGDTVNEDEDAADFEDDTAASDADTGHP